MKAKNYFVFILLLIASFGNAQCVVDAGEDMTITCGDSVRLYGDRNWSYLIDKNNSSSARPEDIFFTNDLIGYMVGADGSIEKTVDGGFHWQTQTSGSTSLLHSVHFVSSTTGIVVGANGTILKTTDSGASWLPQVSGVTEELNSVFFTDTNTGFAVGGNGTILKTTDGGSNWVKKTSGTTSVISSVHFPDANTGYVNSGTMVYKTTNAGESWSALSTFNTTNDASINTVYFTSPTVGYVTGGKPGGIGCLIYKTSDGGSTWTVSNLNWGYATYPIFFTDANTGYAGSVGRIFKTTDAGLNWIPQPVALMSPSSIYFSSAQIGYAVGFSSNSGKVIKYTLPDVVSWTSATGLSATNIVNPLAAPAVTTTYKITTTTGTCIAVDSIKIIVSKLTADAGTDQTLVCGGSAQLSVSSNFTGKGSLQYSWSPATGLSSATIANPVTTVKQTTTYTVTVTTKNGCSATDTVKVFVNPLMVDAGVDQTITCGAKTQFYSPLTNYTGNGTLTYSWSPSASLDDATLPQPVSKANMKTVYHLTLTTPNGCVATDSLTLFVDPLKVTSLGDVSLTCGGSSQFKGVQTNYTGTDALLYSWFPSAGLDNVSIEKPTATVTKNTTYYVLVTTTNSCNATDSVKVLVDALTVNAGADKVHVCGDSIQFDHAISNYTGTGVLAYGWLPVNGLNNATIANPKTGASGIVYTLTVTTPNGCKASDQVKVDIVNMNAPEICMVGVDTTNKNVIRWNNLSNDALDSVLIYKETNVSGNYIKIGSVAALKNGFKDVSSQPEVKSAKYKISVLDTCGLESAKSTYHKTMHLAITQGIGTSWNLIWEPYEGFTVPTYNIYRGTDAKNLQFIDATSGTSTQFTNYNPPPGDLYYQVEVVNPNPCDLSNFGNVLRSNVASNNHVGIFEQEKNTFSFSIYPNPATNLLTVNVENALTKNITLTIYNSIGAIVKSILIQQSKQQIDVSELSNGFYMVELTSTNGHSAQKFTIEK